MTVAVLGSGPAGLMAAYAATLLERDVVILSRKRKSPLYGAQYLHAPIPGITPRHDRVTVEYMLRGTAEQYRRKVYGQMWDGTVSPEDLSDTHEAWDIRGTYDKLWEMFESSISDVELDPAGLGMILRDEGFEFVVNSIPRGMLCHQGHTFRGQQIIAAGDAHDIGIDVGSIYRCIDNTVVCNGEEAPSWYRLSRIFEHTTVEWPASIKQCPLPTGSVVTKPTTHNCDCWPEVFHVGRYGEWRKGVLSHTAYIRTQERITDGEAAQAARYNDPNVPTLW